MIKEILQKNDWTKKPEFLQSWEYGDFLKSTGRTVVRYEVENSNTKQQFQGVVTKMPLGLKFLYVPRVELSEESIKEINKFLQKESYTFWRLELINEIKMDNLKSVQIKNRQPQHTWILDLDKTEEELLTQMHAKTRYNINLSNRKGVICKMEKDIEKYWKLNEMTTERNNIKSHDKAYIKKLLELENVYQLTTYFENEVLSSAIVLKEGETMYYLFGASSNSHRNLMAPYLNQFEIIKLAKQKNCLFYDFWGIAPPAEKDSAEADSHHLYSWQKNNSLSGVAKFKAGFNGHLKSYPKAVEIILQPFKYQLFSFLQKLRKKTIVGHSNQE